MRDTINVMDNSFITNLTSKLPDLSRKVPQNCNMLPWLELLPSDWIIIQLKLCTSYEKSIANLCCGFKKDND